MTGLSLDLRLTLRSLRKTATIFALALLTIALGIGVNTAMFSVISAVLFEPLPYPRPQELVSLWPEKRWALQMLTEVRERVKSYEGTAAWRSQSLLLLGDGLPETVPAAVVTPEFFDVLRSRPALGRGFRAGDDVATDGAVVVLSHALWQRAFGGDPAVVGKVVRLAGAGTASRTVVGVMPRDFTAIPADVEAWLPMQRTPGAAGWFGGYGMSVIGRLKAGVSAEQARAELRRLVPEFTPMHPTQFRAVRYSPVDVLPLQELMTRDVRTRLVVLLGAVGFILLIACTNVANLLLARARGRQREFALQMALGCSPRRVLRQVLAESLVLGVGGGAIGILAAVVTLPVIRAGVAKYLPRTGGIDMDARVLLFGLVASIASGLLFGALPALRAARAAPGEVMRASAGRGQSQGRAAGRVNDLFVVAQIALSLMLLAGAGLMLKSLWRLTRVDTGFDAAQVLTLQLAIPPGRYDSQPSRAALLRRLEEQVGAVPGVETVGAIDFLPLTGQGSGFPYRIAGREAPATSQVVNVRTVTPSYFRALRIPVRRGRMLGVEDVPVDRGVDAAVVVNEAFAEQHWPDGDAIGGRILTDAGEPIGRIVGIVPDVRQRTVSAAPDPEIFLSAGQVGWPGGYLLVRGRGDMPPRQAVLDRIASVGADIGVRNVRPMEDVVRASMDDTRFYARLLTGFATLALVLGLVGVYGVMTYAASRRTREFGVRLAMGATSRDLLGNVMTRAMVPVAAGIVLGIAGALALTRSMRGLLYEVPPGDPWVLGGVALLLASAAAAAALVPARRASRLSPVNALQAE